MEHGAQSTEISPTQNTRKLRVVASSKGQGYKSAAHGVSMQEVQFPPQREGEGGGRRRMRERREGEGEGY